MILLLLLSLSGSTNCLEGYTDIAGAAVEDCLFQGV